MGQLAIPRGYLDLHAKTFYTSLQNINKLNLGVKDLNGKYLNIGK